MIRTNQRIIRPVNAHLISEPRISTQHLLIQFTLNFTILTKFQVTGCNNFQRIHHCHIFPCKSLSCKIRPCRKIDQGQPRLIICKNNKWLRSLMLHTKFHQNLAGNSWKEGFKCFTIYGHGSHIGHATCKMLMNFH